jgi:hypothetical protein
VAPQIPYTQDFEKVPVGAAPGGWINAQGKFEVAADPGNPMNKVLKKVNTNPAPPVAKANAYITTPDATGYTIECDMQAVKVNGKLPDMGVVANRYSLIMEGKEIPGDHMEVLLASWEWSKEQKLRVSKTVPFDWKEKTWYRVKLSVDVREKDALVRGKIWEADKEEPKAWTIEFTDPMPNREGGAGIFGYIANIRGQGQPGSEIYYDNVKVVPNAK